jgi:hypothetical protein
LKGTAVSVIDYRVEYRYIRDYFEPNFIDFNWQNRRLTYQQQLLDLIIAQKDPNYENSDSSGFFIGGGVKLIDKKLALGLGYGTYELYSGTDKQNVEQGQLFVRLEEGAIPNTWADFSYDRKGDLFSDFSDPFENALLDFNVYYRVIPRLTVSLNIRRTERYSAGTVDPLFLFGINTRIDF